MIDNSANDQQTGLLKRHTSGRIVHHYVTWDCQPVDVYRPWNVWENIPGCWNFGSLLRWLWEWDTFWWTNTRIEYLRFSKIDISGWFPCQNTEGCSISETCHKHCILKSAQFTCWSENRRIPVGEFWMKWVGNSKQYIFWDVLKPSQPPHAALLPWKPRRGCTGAAEEEHAAGGQLGASGKLREASPHPRHSDGRRERILCRTTCWYPLVNIQKTMENQHF